MSFKFKKSYSVFCSKNFIIDYKDPKLFDFVTEQVWKIIPRRYIKVKLSLQRKLSKEIKRARYLSLLPYCSKHKKDY